ncbi:MAG: cysteine rich repeat-containing protein [Rhizobiaceae bacterium]
MSSDSMITFKLVLPVLAALSIYPAISSAQEPPQKTPEQMLSIPEVRAAMSACKADVSKFCPTVKPGEGRIVRCLISNRSAIDPNCLSAMKNAKTAVNAPSGAN